MTEERSLGSRPGDRSRRGILWAALFALAGCGLQAPGLLSEDPGLAEVRRGVERAKGYLVEVAPVEIAVADEPREDQWILDLDPEELRRGAADALRECGIFSEVVLEASGSGGAGAEAAGPSRLRLSLRVIGAIGEYKGLNGLFAAQFALWWSLSSLVACLVADETYGASARIEAVLEDPASADPLWSGTVEASFEADLDHYQKGLHLFDLFPPGTLFASYDSGAVDRALAPHLVRKLEVELARRLAAEVPPPAVDVLLLLSAGGDKGAPSAESDADARAFESAFRKNRSRAEVRALPGSAGPGEVLAAVRGLADRRDVRVRDLVLYASGKGTVVFRKDGLFPGLVLGGDAPLELSALLAALGGVPAEGRAAVVDAGFRGRGGRAVPNPVAPPGDPLNFPPGGKAPGLVCPFEDAFASPECKGGILTFFLAQAATPEADADGNGVVTVSEAHAHSAWSVARAAHRAGEEMDAIARGDGPLFRVTARDGTETGDKTPGSR
ncbi:MAG: hypothetical protein MUC63_01080 [Planctomycetes bacterium]|jgi:hypothetical protein|nr:hypothetical protein [Planctomycetota bacterium]